MISDTRSVGRYRLIVGIVKLSSNSQPDVAGTKVNRFTIAGVHAIVEKCTLYTDRSMYVGLWSMSIIPGLVDLPNLIHVFLASNSQLL